jgi:D-sedoheptulose 7-phosphate isomerase
LPLNSEYYQHYVQRLQDALIQGPVEAIGQLAATLLSAVRSEKQVLLCGNGGSAGNAIHLANDFQYGMVKGAGLRLRVEALPSNVAVMTCLANDISYEEVFAEQIRAKGGPGDLLLVLSGSGDSPNVTRALEAANLLGMMTCAIVGFSGGRARNLAQVPVHFAVDDMQIAEDLQLIVGHVCMQWVRTQLTQSVERND